MLFIEGGGVIIRERITRGFGFVREEGGGEGGGEGAEGVGVEEVGGEVGGVAGGRYVNNEGNEKKIIKEKKGGK